MKKADVEIGKSYHTNISGTKRPVLVLGHNEVNGRKTGQYDCQTLSFNVISRSAAALHEIPASPKVKRQGPPETIGDFLTPRVKEVDSMITERANRQG